MKKTISLFISILFMSGIGISNINKNNNLVSNTNIISNPTNKHEEKITNLNMGVHHSSVLTDQNNVYTWGNNSFGQLGDNSTDDKDIPTDITDKFKLIKGEHITELSTGEHHSSALSNQGTVYTWGFNNYGQLGHGLISDKQTPTKITDKFNLSGDEQITQINLGAYHSSALTNKGNVYTWGYNGLGQLGDDSTTNKQTPTKITDKFILPKDEEIIQLDMGKHHSSALTNKGNVYSWGENHYGQLGNNSSDGKKIPTKITDNFNLSGDEQITQLYMGTYHSSALTKSGDVYTWGKNQYGQLGDDSNDNNKYAPTKITDEFNLPKDEIISQLSLGGFHSSALTNKGNVYTWGSNDYGRLGDNTIVNKQTPTKITENFNLSGDEQITQLSMGGYHSSALTNKGNVYTWGNRDFGQLGHLGYEIVPGRVSFSYYISNPEAIEITSNSVKIKFKLNLITPSSINDVNITIWNNNEKIITKTYKSAGIHLIDLIGLQPNEEYNFSISLDGDPKQLINTFKTQVLEEKNGLSTGLIIGIVFGSITGVILIAVTIYFLTKKNKLKRQ